MSNDLVPANQTNETSPFPAGRGVQNASNGINVGAVSIEQERAIAEAQGQLILAKRFPRSTPGSIAEFLDSCKSPEFAASAFYSVPNRGSGPSIRFAEEGARCYGNFQYGHRELSRSEGKSEVEVYAWDMERNNRSTRQITVMHVRDKQGGATKLTDQGDIDNRIANIASKQIRGRILALLPKAMIAAGIAEAKRTLAGGNEKPVSQRIVDMTVVFGRAGVTAAMLEAHLGHKLDQTTIDELADLQGIFNAIREGAKPSDYFTGEVANADHADRLTGGAEKPAKTAEKPAVATRQAKAGTKPTEEQKGPEAQPAKEEAKVEPEPAPAADPKPETKAESDAPADDAQPTGGAAQDDEAVF